MAVFVGLVLKLLGCLKGFLGILRNDDFEACGSGDIFNLLVVWDM